MYKYDAFGRKYFESGPPLVDEFAYTARERHDRTGLYYYRARFYNPQLGRFMTQDPIGMLGGTNLYAYVGNDPVNWIDPLGLAAGYLHPFPTPPPGYTSPVVTWGVMAGEIERKAEYAGRKSLSLGADYMSWEYGLKSDVASGFGMVPPDIPQPFALRLFGAASGLFGDMSDFFYDLGEALDPDSSGSRRCP